MKRIQSNLHQIETYDVNKASLSCFDDKIYILDDEVESFAYSHKDIAMYMSGVKCEQKQTISSNIMSLYDRLEI